MLSHNRRGRTLSIVRRTVTAAKTACACGMLPVAFVAAVAMSMAVVNAGRITPLYSFCCWELEAIVDIGGSSGEAARLVGHGAVKPDTQGANWGPMGGYWPWDAGGLQMGHPIASHALWTRSS